MLARHFRVVTMKSLESRIDGIHLRLGLLASGLQPRNAIAKLCVY